jgi:hypothetical protein
MKQFDPKRESESKKKGKKANLSNNRHVTSFIVQLFDNPVVP